MDVEVEPIAGPVVLANLLAAVRVSFLVRYALVPIFRVKLSYLFHAESE